MKLHVKLFLANEQNEEFLGGGVVTLLSGIQQHGSIQQAAREMELSYVKALKILNRVEQEIGQPLLIRHKGGAEHGSTTLTPYGKRFIREFAAMRSKVAQTAEKAFDVFQSRCKGKNGNGI